MVMVAIQEMKREVKLNFEKLPFETEGKKAKFSSFSNSLFEVPLFSRLCSDISCYSSIVK